MVRFSLYENSIGKIFLLIITVARSHVDSVLYIDGQIPNLIPASTELLLQNHPTIIAANRQFSQNKENVINEDGLLYVGKRELAVTKSDDEHITMLGSDNAITSIIVILKHKHDQSMGLVHIDIPNICNCIDNFVKDILYLGGNTPKDLQLYLIGGFNDPKGITEQNFSAIIQTVHNVPTPIHLELALVGQINTNNNFQFYTGAGIHVASRVIGPARYTNRNPMYALRTVRRIINYPGVADIYDYFTGHFTITQFAYPMNQLEALLNMSDEEIEQYYSNTALAIDNVTETIWPALRFIRDNPWPEKSAFPGNYAKYFKKQNGEWVLLGRP